MVEITYQMLLSTLQTIALIVGITYYLIIMRNSQRTRELTLQSQELARKAQEQAVETRQAQLLMQLWNDAEKYRESGDIWRNLEYQDFDDFWKRYSPEVNPEFWNQENRIMSWYESMGVLVKAGLLDIHLIALSWAGSTRQFWEKFEPLLDGMREKYQYPRLWSETEYLCRELIKYMDEHPELRT